MIIYIIMVLGTIVNSLCCVDFKVSSIATQALPLHIWFCNDNTHETQELVGHLQRCFSFTKQFSASYAFATKLPTKKEVKELNKKEKTLLLVVISPIKDGYEWRLYDTMNGAIIGAQRYKKQGTVLRAWAYEIADQMWPLLTNSEGFFSTKLAYSKKKENKQVKHIYVADFDGSNSQCIVETPTINIASRWNHDRHRPLLFYSDYTPTNVRLKMVGMDKKSSIASDFDGLNMIPAFCDDGTKVAYCISRGDGSCQIYYYDKDTFKNITRNDGNNVSPSLSADGKSIFFCSDFESKGPQLYMHNLETEVTEKLTSGGYVVAPRYNAKVNRVAYAKQVQGVMQLFTYDLTSKQHEQLTFDNLHKQECAWSPCGNWLIYGVGQPGKKSRIAMMNRYSKNQFFLTDVHEDCTYPDWSPRYRQFPVVTVT